MNIVLFIVTNTYNMSDIYYLCFLNHRNKYIVKQNMYVIDYDEEQTINIKPFHREQEYFLWSTFQLRYNWILKCIILSLYMSSVYLFIRFFQTYAIFL